MKRKIYEIIGEAVSFFSFIVFEKDKMNTIKINIPRSFLAITSSMKLIEYAPIMTPGKPIKIPSFINFFSGLFFSKNFNEAPIPRSTVEILCVANATGKVISNSSNIAGSCIIPAPPPEKAENKFDKKETTNR